VWGRLERQLAVEREQLRRLVETHRSLLEQCAVRAPSPIELSAVEGIEAEVDTGPKRAARLRQAILKRAFEGSLVPQDPNDGPAGVLLERIRGERQAHAPVPRRPRRGYTQDGEPLGRP